MKPDVVVIGAGVSGLHAASLLHARGLSCRVIEARDRIGGRALTEGALIERPDLGLFDLGPTWFWPEQQPVVAELVQDLGLETFIQHSEGAMLVERFRYERPQRYVLAEDAMTTSLRISGGVRKLVDAIAARLPEGSIALDTVATDVRQDGTGVIVDLRRRDGTADRIEAKAVLLALPPRMAARRIAFSPALPSLLEASLMAKPTYFAAQAKAIAVFDRPFWREEGLSGFVSSVVGPMQEIHDASPPSGSGALVGFFGMSARMRHGLGRDRVLQLVRDQLVRLFGPAAENPVALLYKDWSADADTAVDEDLEPLSAFPAYGRPEDAGAWAGKLFFAGTETAPHHGGYLEGALLAARHAADEISAGREGAAGARISP